jgi:hypothetical protein
LRDSARVTFVADEACSRSRIYAIASAWDQKLGDFSIARAVNVTCRPGDTLAYIRVNQENGAEIISGEGPLLDQVRTTLDKIQT